MDKIKGVLIDVFNNEIKVVEIDKTPKGYYDILKCSSLDITSRIIGGKSFKIVCDEKGFFAENPKVSAVNRNMNAELVGNLFITEYDGVADITSISDNNINLITGNVVMVSSSVYKEPYPVIVLS